MSIHVKRVYDDPARSDGVRVLVDRLWPRGLTKEAAAIDLWLKDAAPSTELRTWFHADTTRFEEFVERYKAELNSSPGVLDPVRDLLREGETVTLLFASKDVEQNHAHVLARILNV